MCHHVLTFLSFPLLSCNILRGWIRGPVQKALCARELWMALRSPAWCRDHHPVLPAPFQPPWEKSGRNLVQKQTQQKRLLTAEHALPEQQKREAGPEERCSGGSHLTALFWRLTRTLPDGQRREELPGRMNSKYKTRRCEMTRCLGNL